MERLGSEGRIGVGSRIRIRRKPPRIRVSEGRLKDFETWMERGQILARHYVSGRKHQATKLLKADQADYYSAWRREPQYGCAGVEPTSAWSKAGTYHVRSSIDVRSSIYVHGQQRVSRRSLAFVLEVCVQCWEFDSQGRRLRKED